MRWRIAAALAAVLMPALPDAHRVLRCPAFTRDMSDTLLPVVTAVVLLAVTDLVLVGCMISDRVAGSVVGTLARGAGWLLAGTVNLGSVAAPGVVRWR